MNSSLVMLYVYTFGDNPLDKTPPKVRMVSLAIKTEDMLLWQAAMFLWGPEVH